MSTLRVVFEVEIVLLLAFMAKRNVGLGTPTKYHYGIA